MALGPVGAGRPHVFDPSAPRAIEWTVEALLAGSVVAFPTDTVYGLAALIAQEEAVARIYAIKGRPADKPLPVLLSTVAHLPRIAAGGDALALLADRFWPGPLTIVLPARPGLPPAVLGHDEAGTPTIGVRVPAHFLALEIIDRAGGILAVTSANRSGEEPARTAAEVVAALAGEVDVVVDGGQAPGGVASTVVAARGSELAVLRAGAISAEELMAVWREVRAGAD